MLHYSRVPNKSSALNKSSPCENIDFLIRALGPNKSSWLESPKYTGMNFLFLFFGVAIYKGSGPKGS